MMGTQRVFPLKGKVQHYSWGGYHFIPELLSLANSEKKPFAEYWLGAHPNHPSEVEAGNKWIPLNEFISDNKTEALGEATAQQFGMLPFLLKILDVRQMLSIQVHPAKESAEEGFESENKLGIPLTAGHRNYKDDNHKPELMVALSDFWLLHGFKPAAQLEEILSAIPDFEFLEDKFRDGGYKGLYETVMLMEQEEVNKILEPVIARILPLYKNGELLKSSESFWAARAVETYCKDGNYDRGIFSIYFFNLVHLKKGEGVFQPAQLPHAYLEGQNVELMANSDNVLRAGLTDKHIDVAELMRHVQFEETIPFILGSHAAVSEEIQFQTPVPEFELYQYRLDNNSMALESGSAEVILVLEGGVEIISEGEALTLSKGAAAFVQAGTVYTLKTNGEADVFKASVPHR
ncbi:MAG TPA: mannose-6-phosphate isomerase, class I [Chitinophagaceae bacterium]|nr:mannose-6-phosphate isomerase, class I [Chitinophagaceae bacterium]